MNTPIPVTTAIRDPELRYLEALQEPMEQIALGEQPNRGPFCGHCYARLAPAAGRTKIAPPCAVCGHTRGDPPLVTTVPAEVLAIYLAKRKREGFFVNGFAFLGMFVAMAISAMLWLVLPAGLLDILPFVVLIAGAYFLARLFGFWFGAELGYASGCRIREQRWLRFLAERRQAGPNPTKVSAGNRADQGRTI